MSQPNSWVPEGLPDPNTIQPDRPQGHIPGAGPGGMQYGQVTPAPEHELVYPAGDPVITPQPNGNGSYPTDPQGITDLTNRRPRPMFRIGDEVYYGKVEIATGVMMRYAARAAQLQKTMDPNDSEAEVAETVKMFRLMLRRESADRLVGHLHMVPAGATEEDEARISEEAEDDDNAVGMQTFMKLLPWLMEQYGMAPTEPSSNAAAGSSTSQDGGNESTPTSPEQGSTSLTSPSTEP